MKLRLRTPFHRRRQSVAGGPNSCPRCLRHAYALAELAPHVEAYLKRRPVTDLSWLLRLDAEELGTIVAPDCFSVIQSRVENLSDSALDADMSETDCWATCRHDEWFPEGLRDIPCGPPVLIGKGDRSLLGRLTTQRTVTVAGSRQTSSYGRRCSHLLGRSLAEQGVAVVSGLSIGIEASAHRGAIESGLTVAVPGSGPDAPYPSANRSLSRRIVDDGLVLSELPPRSSAWRWSLFARDRIMAALAGMTIVVEAVEGSQAISLAHLARDLSRHVGAVPGPVDSQLSGGPNQLLATGGHIVRNAQDVLEILGERPERRPEALDSISA
jgi:DNA protecting protein DprA